MEKQSKIAKIKFLKFLPKASAVTFQNLPFSPTKPHAGKFLTCPVTSIIQAEARLKLKNSSFEAQEPTSPKISCMGQIKHKKKLKKEKVERQKQEKKIKPDEEKKQPIVIRHVYSGGEKPAGRKSDASADKSITAADCRAPSLSQMKRFASGRDSLPKFDWTSEISPADGARRKCNSGDENDREEEKVIFPSPAPIFLNGVALEPKKEINLWKRRTMSQPRPLLV